MEHVKPKNTYFQIWVVYDPCFDEHKLREDYIGEFETVFFDVVLKVVERCFKGCSDYRIIYFGCEKSKLPF